MAPFPDGFLSFSHEEKEMSGTSTARTANNFFIMTMILKFNGI